jgi:hypothetical protein
MRTRTLRAGRETAAGRVNGASSMALMQHMNPPMAKKRALRCYTIRQQFRIGYTRNNKCRRQNPRLEFVKLPRKCTGFETCESK